MARMVADCRDFPSESGCTLTIAGEEDEVVSAAAIHATTVHGHDFDFVGPAISSELLGDGVAIAVRKPDTALRNELNCALEQLKQSGEYQRIIQPYRLDAVPAEH